MGNRKEEEAVKKPNYIFSELEGYLAATEISFSIMERGILIGDRLFMAVLGWEKETGIREKPVLGVASLEEGQIEVSEENLAVFQLSPFKRYAFLSPADELTVFLMAKRGNASGKEAILVVDSGRASIKAEDAGINFVR